MTTERVLISLILVCFVISITIQLTGEFTTSFYFDFLIVPLITLTYIISIKNKEIMFLLFLIVYALGDIISIIGFLLEEKDFETASTLFTLSSIFFIIAYSILLIKTYRLLSLKYVIKHLRIHGIVMVLLNIYLLYVLQAFIKENSTTNNLIIFHKEFIYNAVTLLLLTISFLNYLYWDSQKSLFLFSGVLALVFCEVFEITYIYISQQSYFSNEYTILISIANTLSLGGFYLLYRQSKLIE